MSVPLANPSAAFTVKVARVAVPFESNGAEPIPRKFTVPVGVPDVLETTLAVNVVVPPVITEPGDAVTVVVVAGCGITVSVVVPLEAVKFPVALKLAVMVSVPTANPFCVFTAMLLRVAVPLLGTPRRKGVHKHRASAPEESVLVASHLCSQLWQPLAIRTHRRVPSALVVAVSASKRQGRRPGAGLNPQLLKDVLQMLFHRRHAHRQNTCNFTVGLALRYPAKYLGLPTRQAESFGNPQP